MESLKEKSYILGNLNKATYIELFFDLVFIVCMRSITPVLWSGQGDVAGWYECYTFVFCFILMVQIWFSSTVLMNRCGTGSLKDVRFLLVNMFLLFLMTRVISTGWEYYYLFNTFWMLINVNMIHHWASRLRRMAPDAAAANKPYILRVIITHAAAIVLVFASMFCESVPAQIFCLIAVLVGFVSWPNGRPLSESGREHLAERCALFLILAFGEVLVSLGSTVSEVTDSYGVWLAVFISAFYFLVIAGMFLAYLVFIEKRLDVSKLGAGSRYMAITTLLLFCIMSITASLELALEGKNFFFMPDDYYFSIAASVYLLAFFLFIPFMKPPVRQGKRWLVARIVLSCLPMLTNLVEYSLLYPALISDETSYAASIALGVITMLSIFVFMFSSAMVFLVDFKQATPKRERKHKRKRDVQAN